MNTPVNAISSSPVREEAFLLLPNGHEVPLNGVVSIGRQATNHIQLDAPKVSRQHCCIITHPHGYQLVDYESTNGTYLNETKVAGPKFLKHGDLIRIGSCTLRFICPVEGMLTGAAVEPAIDQTVTALDSRTCWLMVADIVDSTRLLHVQGSEQFMDTRRVWLRHCHRILQDHHGHLNQGTGDGFLALWSDEGDPTTHHLIHGLRAFLELMQTGNLSFRLAFHHGMVTFGGSVPAHSEAIAGPEVHFTFRLEKAGADLGEVVIFSQQASKRLQPYLPLVSRGTFPMKGFTREAEVFALDLARFSG